jgi:hypothetical protein
MAFTQPSCDLDAFIQYLVEILVSKKRAFSISISCLFQKALTIFALTLRSGCFIVDPFLPLAAYNLVSVRLFDFLALLPQS